MQGCAQQTAVHLTSLLPIKKFGKKILRFFDCSFPENVHNLAIRTPYTSNFQKIILALYNDFKKSKIYPMYKQINNANVLDILVFYELLP